MSEVPKFQYSPGAYSDINPETIAQDALREGFKVSMISDPAGFVYVPHMHPEAKFLGFIAGSMKVTVATETVQCVPGDKLVIQGNTLHSAVAGQEGCSFLWSEKLA